MPRDGSALYFIAIVPPSPIFEQASELKNHFKERYQSKASLNSPPHITLHMPFEWREKKEDDLILKLKLFSKNREIFDVQLQDFSCFTPRVIFIQVLENTALRDFQSELHQFCKTELNIFNAQYKDMPFHPHLTLAFRDLKKPMFEKAWKEFSQKQFSESFAVKQFMILKHTGKVWVPLMDFVLESGNS